MPTNHLYTVSGTLLARNVTRAEAIAISNFARRPVYWGSDVVEKPESIGGHYMSHSAKKNPSGVPYGN